MFYSHKLEEESFLLFTLFINNILQGKNDYSSKVNSVIKEAKDLAKGEKDFYSLDKDNYPITVFLSKNAKEYLQRINPDSLSDHDYEQLLQIVENQGCVPC